MRVKIHVVVSVSYVTFVDMCSQNECLNIVISMTGIQKTEMFATDVKPAEHAV